MGLGFGGAFCPGWRLARSGRRVSAWVRVMAVVRGLAAGGDGGGWAGRDGFLTVGVATGRGSAHLADCRGFGPRISAYLLMGDGESAGQRSVGASLVGTWPGSGGIRFEPPPRGGPAAGCRLLPGVMPPAGGPSAGDGGGGPGQRRLEVGLAAHGVEGQVMAPRIAERLS